jgi:two-component system, NtrC family, sensor histidine kinase PilS
MPTAAPTKADVWPASTHELAHTAGPLDRFWLVFMRARLAVAAVLLALQVFVLVLGSSANWLGLLLCGAHMVATVTSRLAPGPQTQQLQSRWPWLPTVGWDMAVFAGLQMLQHGGLNYTLLFALPVLMTAILGSQRRALATAATVTLFLLADAGWAAWVANDDITPRFFQTAITSTAFFLVALLAHQLALRLAREVALSHKSELAARTQALVNELVIESMNDGVLVVNALGLVLTANPAARHMLGDAAGDAPASFGLATRPHAQGLTDLVLATFTQQIPQRGEVLLEPAQDLRRRLRVRSNLTHTEKTASRSERLCVVFLEDLHELEARVRTEKLAGMGRMSVAVAHEIRNPLSAIAQANALLLEDLRDPQNLRLAQMVATHTQRLNRVVDDVLNVARVPGQLAPADTPAIGLDVSVGTVLTEWCQQHGNGQRVRWHPGCGDAPVQFDPEHLRRVMVNLLDNASRYASTADGAVRVGTQPDTHGWLRLSVWSDGSALEHSVRRHLFEPFFSSESRSSGMGLYLCRELCERYRAQLNYQRSERDGQPGNDFFLRLPTVQAHPPS